MSKTAQTIKKLIEVGNYNKEDLTFKLDVFLIGDRISSDEYNALIEMME